MNTLNELLPKKVWEIFYELTQIPRPSKKEGKAVEYAKKFGEKLGLETIVDKVGNVIISKPASQGFEDRMGVVLQAHLDMVPQKNSDTKHDFDKDPIQAYVDGEWVKARGTTLGSDNGIGVASALSVLADDKLQHGPLEVLLTIDEETGMTGAFELEPDVLKGDILLNLDSEDEGELYIGCAGGMNTSGRLSYKESAIPSNMKAFMISVKGLRGGHSGLDISLGRANATKLLFRFLWAASEQLEIRIASVEGGNLRNAIPREAFAVVLVPDTEKDNFSLLINKFSGIFKSEYSNADPGLQFMADETEMPKAVMNSDSQEGFIRMIYGIPHGVMEMSSEMAGIVETSTNLAIVKADNGEASATCLIRSSVDSAKLSVGEMTQSVMELAGAEVTHDGEYPGWKPDVNSAILRTMKDVYQKKYGKIPEIKVIHAGLECGIIGDVYKNMELISFGPTIRFPHSPDEKVNIASVGKFWDFLTETLKNIPVK